MEKYLVKLTRRGRDLVEFGVYTSTIDLLEYRVSYIMKAIDYTNAHIYEPYSDQKVLYIRRKR
jgi:hypothetical protein